MRESSGRGPEEAGLIISLLGTFDVRHRDEPLMGLRSRKGHQLLAFLVLRQGAEVERSWLAGILWPDSDEPQALASLRNSLKELRRALGEEAWRLHSPTSRTLAFDLSCVQVDLIAFDEAIRRGDPLSLESAVALYRGPLLQGWPEEWLFQERQMREQSYLTALETLAARALKSGQPGTAEGYLRRAVAVDPVRESAQRELLRAVAAQGNYAAATQVYRDLRLLLHRELNADPAPETVALYQRIREESRLHAPVPSSGPSHPTLASVPTGLPEGSRRPPFEMTVTFLFTDIEGSTRLWEEQPEGMRCLLPRHDALLRQAVERHAGRVFKSLGDGLCAVFASATAAVTAALEGKRLLRSLVSETLPELRVRMALHTGPAEERDDDYFGPSLNRAARLLSIGHGGQLLLSVATCELVRDDLPEGESLRDLGHHRLRDLQRPEHVFQIVSPDGTVEFPPLRSLGAYQNNLPVHLTSFVGREEELSAVRQLLPGTRLLTLTGPGGTGKTRLALQTAVDLLEEFPEGVHFVDLSSVDEPTRVASTIAQAVDLHVETGQRASEALMQYLRDRKILLVLDNFEQVIEAAPLLVQLLKAAQSLRLLVTSRAPLRVEGEQELAVPPLATPDLRQLPSTERLAEYAAVALFIDRARAVKPDFTLSAENAAAVVGICQRLDGLPLAIELASARIKLFPPQALLARLSSRLALLTDGARDRPTRQRTLRGAIAWSYDLLSEDERRLFRRLSVFTNGCTLEAAEAVCSLSVPMVSSVLDGVASLLDKSLIRLEETPEGESRFSMLETIREFGQECLRSTGEEEELKRQHASYFLDMAEQATVSLKSTQQIRTLHRLAAETDNLRAALEWARESHQCELCGRLALVLYQVLHRLGSWEEARTCLQIGLTASEPVEAEISHLRAALRLSLAIVLHDMGSHVDARHQAEQTLAIARESNDLPTIADALNLLGLLAIDLADLDAAEPLLHQVLGLLGEHDPSRRGKVLNNLARVASCRGDLPRAMKWYEEALRCQRRAGDPREIALALGNLGAVLQNSGELAAARVRYRESLAIRSCLQDRHGIAVMLNNLGELAETEGDLETAVALFSHAARLLRDLRSPHLHQCEVSLERLSQALGVERCSQLQAAAEEKTWEQILHGFPSLTPGHGT